MTWVRTRVDRVATVNARIGWKALTASEYQPDGYVFLATPNIKSGSIDFDNVNYISEYRYEESPELKLQPDDVLLAKDGNTLGITNIVRELPRPATVNGSIAVLRPFAVEPRFLRYALASSSTQGMIEAIKGGMGVPHLFQWDIKRLPLDLPPLDEQRRISDYLDRKTTRIDALIAAKRRMMELLEEQFQACIENELVVPQWPTVPLRRLLKVPPQYGANESGVAGPADWPRYIRITDLRSDGSLTNEGIQRLPPTVAAPFMLAAEDLLVARSGATVGKSFVYRSGMEPAAFAGYLIRLRFNSRKLLSDVAYLWMQSTHYWQQLRATAIQATIENVSAERYKEMQVPLPPLNLQTDIIARLSSYRKHVRAVTSRLEYSISLLQERRQALITAAVTGQLDISEAA